MNRILKAYLKRLTNLSTRNKSLLLPGLPSEQFLDIYDTDFLLGKSCLEVVQQLVQKKTRLPLCDVQDPRLERSNDISKKLRKIARTESFIQEERGSRDLYIGYPFVRGKLSDGTPIHAPLLFFPVTLRIDKEQWCLFEREEAGVTLNRSFALAYAHFNESVISDEVLEKSFEDFSKDFLEFRTQLYEWLKETPFRINFNQALFEDKILPFDAQKSSELELLEKNGELKLFPEAVLGIFPQAGSYLVPDYNKLLEINAQDPLKMILLESDGSDSVQKAEINSDVIKENIAKIREEDILTPFSIDESQEKIILSVKSGKSVVVQGPPGSGKSQLICNLMADFASRGKRVLLVCQKRAALDVVHQRLKGIGMAPFSALIHDFKNDRLELYRQFASQIEHVESYRQQNYSLDAVFLEREFTQESRNIDRTVEELNRFRNALFDENEGGIPVKELYLTSDQSGLKVDLSAQYKTFRLDQWDDYKRRLKVFAKYSLYINAAHPWADRKSFADFGLSELQVIEKMLADWPSAYHQQSMAFTEISGRPYSQLLTDNRKEVLERLEDITGLVTDDVTFSLFKSYLASDLNTHERLSFVRQVTESLEGFLAEDGIEFSLERSELSSFRGKLKKVIDAKQSAVTGMWWDLFGSEKKEISQVAQGNNLTTSVDHLLKLELIVRNRIELESWLENKHVGYLEKYLDSRSEKSDSFGLFFRRAESAADASVRAKLPLWFSVIKQIALETEIGELFNKKINQLINWLKVWDRMESVMVPFLLPIQIDRLFDDPNAYSSELWETLAKDFDSMSDMDRLWKEMSINEQLTTKIVLENSVKNNVADPSDIVNLFDNSIRLAWITHIENKFPQLRAVTSLKMQQWEEQLQESILSKQNLSSEITAIKLREQTYQDVEKNRLGNRVTYRELNHQVAKKRKIWPIRKLLENYQEEIFSLVPCWMASPEAVSAIFPMESDLFDLVIFDEASQCYAEYGLPAAFRGKQIVVTGDSKQLSPSDLYKVRYEEKTEEEEYAPALEIESLLDLAAQSLEQYQLSGHYRSLSLDLIDFSNQHFYKNTLRLLPDFNKLNQKQPGIKYIKVDGIWKQNANLLEAEAVINLLKELAGGQSSIGVVTFNIYQQQVIQEAVEREQISVKDLFVKNIENVQGDERDIVIFSMGYAHDEKGKLSMQFGSLNAQGGENRLNVAVTRAREKIYFVTSLWPSQLNTDSTANTGPKLLKAYLQYALDVSEGNYQPEPLPTDHFRTDWLLKNRLIKLNKEYKKELPFSDLTIKEEEAYKGLILTDDDLYHRSETSKEPHAYLPLLLRQKHWPFNRVYSRQYWTKTMNLENSRVL
ncbi:AAA domain-containing protein [Dyadobacter psychrotolerans]|uniref:DUF4011 domain-containing protein n=1 Tax=Dyadobacter psychrotolerans TaxID=2541721 RepID=A0A4R5DAQ3_9BACT|nr:AAA domain-containing protein [Dyadobacter psychrotolerans]TDE08544.1 DUF4011 domain-containing protein [Dyadobacter psychrotolerans]